MADEGSSQEKTEEATPKRLRDARKKGQVAKSRDLTTVVILIAAFGALVGLVKYITGYFEAAMHNAFSIASKKEITNEELFLYGQDSLMIYIKTAAPFLGILFLAALFIGFLQIGPIFSAEPLKPQTRRLNMIQNIKNMFKITTLVELIKNILKVFLVFFLAYLAIKENLDQVLLTVSGTLPQSAAVAAHVVVSFLIKVLICFVVVSILDFGFQRWHYKKEMKMSREEVKREYKQDEGDPLIKSHRRQLHQELAMSDMKRSVAASDVVITNPTEVAVAVKYDEKEMMAPQVMAKGQRLFAEAIREVAAEFDIPIIQNVPLAWTLLELDVGDEIPEELYTAVAEVLVIIYRMREEKEGKLSDNM